jgi:hypothetical protein
VRRIMSKEGGADGLSDGQRRQTVMPWQGKHTQLTEKVSVGRNVVGRHLGW